MVSSPGATGYNGLVLPVISTETTNTILRGMVCAISTAASNPAASFLSTATQNRDYQAGGGVAGTILQTDIPLMQVQRGVVDINSINPVNVGIAKADILPGKIGEMTVFGYARVLMNGALAVGEVISSAAAGKCLDAVSATHFNPFGMLAEAVSAGDVTAGTLRWALVNFLSVFGNGNAAAAYAQNVEFMGKAY